MIEPSRSFYFKTRAGIISGALLIISVVIASVNPVFAGVPMPDVPKVDSAKGKQCVEETSFMRRNHMDLLDHQRDNTMRKGIRTKKHSLQGCLDCHAVYEDNAHENKTQKVAVTIKSPKHFCNSCHSYAAVKIDCFGCHNSKPFIKKAPKLKLEQTALLNKSGF